MTYAIRITSKDHGTTSWISRGIRNLWASPYKEDRTTYATEGTARAIASKWEARGLLASLCGYDARIDVVKVSEK